MKDKKIAEMSNEELQKQIADAELELMKLHGQSATGTPPQKPAQIRALRRSIARFKTAMNKEVSEKK